ncbi:unnamed protein product [Linum trigynum]|uniref:Uncharacterized protein n=1 Tax=Linum trigynum TaxID=586398 RepID=A0AAV2DK57_9ROSI
MSIPPRHDLTTSQGKARSEHYIKYLIKEEKQYYGAEALFITHPLQETFLAARRFFLGVCGKSIISVEPPYMLHSSCLKSSMPTIVRNLPRLVVEYFPDASEYEMKYTEIGSLLLKQMAREDFDAPIATSKPSALALVATSMIASYPDPPVFSTDNVLNVNEVDFQRYVEMMQGN